MTSKIINDEMPPLQVVNVSSHSHLGAEACEQTSLLRCCNSTTQHHKPNRIQETWEKPNGFFLMQVGE